MTLLFPSSGNPKMETLTDSFNTGSLDTTKWTQFTGGGATISYAGNNVNVAYPASSTSSTDGDIVSNNPYTLISSYAILQVPTVPSSLTSADAELRLRIDANNYVRWVYEGGTLFAQQNVLGVRSTLTSFAYNATNHAWWRIRESGGTTFWDTSIDGIAWTNQTSTANPITLTGLKALIAGTCFQNESNPGNFIFDNFNTPSLITSWQQKFGQYLIRTRKRQQPPVLAANPFYGIPATGAIPSVSSWVKPVNQPTRRPKRQQVNKATPPYPAAPSQPPYLSYWKRPVEQPVVRRVKRQQPGNVQPPSQLPSQAPYLSYWKHPVEQPQIRRTKRQQPGLAPQNPYYGIPTGVVTPSVAGWVKPFVPIIRRVKRQQPQNIQPPVQAPSQAPYVSYWKRPVEQPVVRRVKRQQINRVLPQPPQASQAPYVSYWKRPVEEPVIRRVKRQQPTQSQAWFTANLASINPSNDVSFWKRPVEQYQRRPTKRQPVGASPLPSQLPSAPPYVTYWIRPVNQPQRKNIRPRQQPVTKRVSDFMKPAAPAPSGAKVVYIVGEGLGLQLSPRVVLPI